MKKISTDPLDCKVLIVENAMAFRPMAVLKKTYPYVTACTTPQARDTASVMSFSLEANVVFLADLLPALSHNCIHYAQFIREQRKRQNMSSEPEGSPMNLQKINMDNVSEPENFMSSTSLSDTSLSYPARHRYWV
ncbi:hypothetical protein FSARC_10186 [Fusarium sarcochroum]|uniref:Uncharacterized protein n=1 Tax=Fusarium sarcochroum TaxID=1208366 RepID=A0A8H4TP07_9HYPO|nr:hypothetical protein FSARC_10186 [Fusarium sarcochroum]